VKLVDASFLIDYARGDEAAIAYLPAYDEEEIGASTIVLSDRVPREVATEELNECDVVATMGYSTLELDADVEVRDWTPRASVTTDHNFREPSSATRTAFALGVARYLRHFPSFRRVSNPASVSWERA
jgi:hypothetical protein